MLVAKRTKANSIEESKSESWGLIEQKNYECKKKYRRAFTFTTKLINLDHNLISTAIRSLQHHNKLAASKPKNTLTSEDDYIKVCIYLSKSIPLLLPLAIQLTIPFPIYTVESKICVLFDKFEPEILKSIKKSPLANSVKFKDHEALNKLHLDKVKFGEFADSYELFFCDSKYYEKIPKMLKEFLGKRNKCPYPIDINNDWEEIIKLASERGYFTIRKAGRFEFNVAKTSMEVNKGTKNIIAAIYQAVSHILLRSEKHNNIESIALKTNTSIELPIYKLKRKSLEKEA